MNHSLCRMLALLSCLTLLLTGCTQAPAEDADIIYIPDDALEQMEEPTLEMTLDWATEEQRTLLAQNFAMDAADEDFLAALEGHSEFPDLAFVPFEEALTRYAALPELEQELPYGIVTDLPLDPDDFYERVASNNAAKKRTEGLSGRVELSEEDVRWACDILCETFNRELSENDFPDKLDDLDYTLGNLCLFGNVGLENAAVLDDGTVTLSRTMAENMIMVSNNPEADRIVISHEAEHLIQKTSVANVEALGVDRGYGFMVAWEDMGMTPLYCSWLIEAAAESLAVRLYDADPITYKYKVGYLNSLSLIAMLDGHAPTALARLTQQESMDALYAMYRCETAEEQLELLQVLYAIEVIQEEPEAYMTAYTAETGREINESELTVLKKRLKASLMQTLNRYFYRSLSHAVTERELTTEEVCYLISLWEVDMHKHLGYTESGNAGVYRPVLDEYMAIQNSFFASAAAEMGVDAGLLAETCTDYYTKLPVPSAIVMTKKENKTNPLEIGSFDSEENAFVNTCYWDCISEKAVLPVIVVS